MFNVAEKLVESNLIVIKEEVYDINKKEKYEKVFEDFKNKGAIVAGSNFIDKKWRLTDGFRQFPINYTLNEVVFTQQKKERGLEFEIYDLENALKFLTLIKLRSRDVATVYACMLNIKNGFKKTDFYSIKKMKSFRLEQKENKNSNAYKNIATATIEFLDYFERLEIDENYFNLLEHLIEIQFDKNIRDLPTFTSFFKFEEKMNEFIENATAPEKLFYFPIILWWKISPYVPMRTTELTVTPYDCISNKDGKYILTVMKTTEKGWSDNYEFNHSGDSNFIPLSLEVNKNIYDLICEYKFLVDKYDNIDNFYGHGVGAAGKRKYLLSLRGYIRSLEKNQNIIAASYNIIDYLPSHILNKILKWFYKNVLEGKYKMTIFEKGKNKVIGINEIEIMQCMDTRHFSIMNLLMQDFSPIAVKELAGHNTIITTYGYYNHIETFVESYTYHLAKTYSKRDGNSPVLNLDLSRTSNVKNSHYKKLIESGSIIYANVENGNGWCIYNKEDCFECAKYEFHCTRGCRYYISKDGNDIDEAILSNKDKIKTGIMVIKELIKDRKTIKDFEASYKTEISRIKSCAQQNAAIISEHMMQK